MDEKWLLASFIGIFLLFYFMPQGEMLERAVYGGLAMAHEYAREHVLTCLIPALFIAGAISALLQKDAVLKYLGAKANKLLAYSVASVSGSVLAVCSCTVLPLFAGIWKRGAGLGPATTFLYSGPAINILAIFLTASVLGFQLGVARAAAAVALSIAIGFCMELIFKSEKVGKENLGSQQTGEKPVSLRLAAAFIFAQILFLVVSSLQMEFHIKIAAFIAIIAAVAYIAIYKFERQQTKEWLAETWLISKSILPMLFIGILVAGAIGEVLPQELIEAYLGGNGLEANLAASIVGAFMYFATLTEIPIIQALSAKGMGAGPSIALLLSGPSLSLPSMLVISRILGLKKTIAYVALVIVFSTLAGIAYGIIASAN